MLDLVLNSYSTSRTFDKGFFRDVLGVAIEEADRLAVEPLSKKNVGVSINLVGTGRIKALNKKYRGKNKVTDVLSFPMTKAGTDFFKESKGDTIDLGDIFIALPVVKKESRREFLASGKETKNPAKDQKEIDRIAREKLARTAVHGFLHLLGYDHEDAKDGGKMLRLQEEIVKKWLEHA